MNDQQKPVTPNNKVLIVAYAFPPVGGIAAQRPLKFVRYLRDYGWDPIVLTTKDAYSATMDASLLDEIPEGVEVIRVRDPLSSLVGKIVGTGDGSTSSDSAIDSTRTRSRQSALKTTLKTSLKKWKARLLVPDDQVLWAIQAAKVGRQVALSRNIQCVYTTSGPHSTQLVGWWIRRTTNVKWVADFRDPWVDNLHFEHSGRRKDLERGMEKAVFKRADHVITVTGRFQHLFHNQYPAARTKISVIRNGVDPADFLQPVSERTEQTRSEVFRFFYAGILYQRRSPHRFFQALSLLLQRQVVHPSQIRVEFAGVFDYPGHTENADLVRTLKLENVVTDLGYLPRSRVLERMQASDALLLIGETGQKATQYVPGKLYEYLFAERPVLAMVEEGESAEILRTTRTGIVVSPHDVTAIASAIQDLVQKRNGVAGFDPQWPIISQYSRVTQTEELAKLLNRVVNPMQSVSNHLLFQNSTSKLN